MCAGGALIKAEEALRFGIIDRLIEGDLLTGAIAFAREVAAQPIRKTRDRNEKLGTPAENAAIFAAARDAARKKQRGMNAPLAAIDAVEASTKLPFAEGCALERKLFIECLQSDQSKALIHVFFSERKSPKFQTFRKTRQPFPSSAQQSSAPAPWAAASPWFSPTRASPSSQGRPTSPRSIAALPTSAKTTPIPSRAAASPQAVMPTERLNLIQPTLTYDGFEDVDIIIEAVFEGMAIKKEVFGELDRVCKPGAILATNTSTLDIDEIASTTSRPEFVIGTHFFSPANVMRLLEIVRGKRTSKEVIATAMALSKKLGKIGVLVGNCRGFVGNRMFHPYVRESVFLVEEGASVEDVDKALYDFGMAMGPLAVGDLAGLDIGWRIRKEYRHLEKPGIRQPFAGDRLCEMGRYGQKTGAAGTSTTRSAKPFTIPKSPRSFASRPPNPASRSAKYRPPKSSIAASTPWSTKARASSKRATPSAPSDIDIIYINGYGFPAQRGGPMWYADTVGLQHVYDRVSEFHRQHGELWQPAPLLQRLAAAGKTFAQFGKEETAAV